MDDVLPYLVPFILGVFVTVLLVTYEPEPVETVVIEVEGSDDGGATE